MFIVQKRTKKVRHKIASYIPVHICTRRSSAQLLQVIVLHNHGHLFLLLDIIMGIPIQAQAIPMKSCDVKARLRQGEVIDIRPDGLSYLIDFEGKVIVRGIALLKPVF